MSLINTTMNIDRNKRRNNLWSMANFLLSACLALSLSGCATTDEINNQANPCWSRSTAAPLAVYSLAVADVDSRGKTYVITSAMKDLGDDDLEFQVAARYVRNALSQRGYIQVDSKEKADQMIRLAYGVGDAQTTTTTTTTPGYSYPVGWWWYFVPPTSQTDQRTIYTTSVVLAAYDLKTPGKLPQIWKSTLSFESTWDRVPKNSMVLNLMPNMIAPAVPYLGTNKGQVAIFHYNGKCQAVMDILKE